MMKQRSSTGFTLIELLIVVAIIGILAAIAIPNFLQAQTRAKVARARSDLRNAGSALELYYVDNNVYPPRECNNHLGRWHYGSFSVWRRLTTPVDYVSAETFKDPFVTHLPHGAFDVYVFLVHNSYNTSVCHSHGIPPRFMTIRKWSAHSHGPDRINNANSIQILIYDPTNGTISNGDIWLIDSNMDVDASYQWP